MSWLLLRNSLLVASFATVLAGILGFTFALFAAGLNRNVRRLAVGLAIVSLILPPFLVSNTWLNYLGLTGTWRSVVDFNLYSLPGTVLLLILQLWSIPFLMSFAAVCRIDRTYLDQEPFLRTWSLVRFLILPACRPALGFGLLLTFVLALNNFTIPALLQTKVFAAEVWLSFNTKFDYAEALHLSWPLVVGPLIVLLAFRFRPLRWVARGEQFPYKLWKERLGFFFPLSAAAGIALLVLSVGLSLFQLVGGTRTWTEFLPAISAGKSAVANSLLFAICSGLLVVSFGVLAARARFGWITWLFFLTPGVLLGIACVRIFNQPAIAAFYQSIGIVLVAFSIRYLALGWSGARAAFANTDRSLLDVISVFGGSHWQKFRFAVWPQSKPLLWASFYLVYLLCLWEVETLILIVPPGRETLALRVFNMLHYGHAGQVDALCVWMLLLGLAPAATYFVLRRAHLVGTRSTASLIFVLPLLLVGCGVHDPSATRLDSKFFGSVQVFGNRGTGVGQFNKPRSIAVDREDNFYVVDMTGRVQKFSPDGKFILSWQMPQTDKGKPKGMACDIDGNILVVEPHYSRVNHFSPDGKLLAQWGTNGTNVGQLFFPRAVAVNSHGEIYLSEYGVVERIQEFGHKGTNFIRSVGHPGTGPEELNRAEGIGCGPKDQLFVADSCNHRVQIISPEGHAVAAFGRAGSDAGEMSYPYDVRVDRLGNRFVCEFGNSRVQVFDANNDPIEILGGAGAEPGQMNNPWAIALDSRGNLYVADSLNHRVQKFIRREPLLAAK